MIPRWLTDNLTQVAGRLRPLKIDFAFLGGCIVPFLLDDPDLMPMRPTNDVDVVLLLIRQSKMAEIEERVRRQGFVHADYDGAPICRWKLGEITVDIMPDKDAELMGLNTRWFSEALHSARIFQAPDGELPIISAPTFVATKLSAYADRGRGDFYHRDLEDVITVIDGRASFQEELAACNTSLKNYVADEIQRYLADPHFVDALAGHLPGDAASQARLSSLYSRLLELSTSRPDTAPS
jgi:predicted nucleotidyltransferase